MTKVAINNAFTFLIWHRTLLTLDNWRFFFSQFFKTLEIATFLKSPIRQLLIIVSEYVQKIASFYCNF